MCIVNGSVIKIAKMVVAQVKFGRGGELYLMFANGEVKKVQFDEYYMENQGATNTQDPFILSKEGMFNIKRGQIIKGEKDVDRLGVVYTFSIRDDKKHKREYYAHFKNGDSYSISNKLHFYISLNAASGKIKGYQGYQGEYTKEMIDVLEGKTAIKKVKTPVKKVKTPVKAAAKAAPKKRHQTLTAAQLEKSNSEIVKVSRTGVKTASPKYFVHTADNNKYEVYVKVYDREKDKLMSKKPRTSKAAKVTPTGLKKPRIPHLTAGDYVAMKRDIVKVSSLGIKAGNPKYYVHTSDNKKYNVAHGVYIEAKGDLATKKPATKTTAKPAPKKPATKKTTAKPAPKKPVAKKTRSRK